MTVLEKIKRCVSLVWDFQEIYDEEDIEDFCRNELHTYSQHDEIMEYFKHLAELEKENAELKEQNRNLLESCEGATMMYKDLCKAKGLLKAWYQYCIDTKGKTPLKIETAQFLSEVEK